MNENKIGKKKEEEEEKKKKIFSKNKIIYFISDFGKKYFSNIYFKYAKIKIL